MKDMIITALNVLGLAAFMAFASCSTANTVTWGAEVWTCGNATFQVRVGTGADIVVNTIAGTISAGPTVGALNEPPINIRQSLVAVYSPLMQTMSTVLASPAPANHSIDRHMFATNIKQVGVQTVHVPVSATLEPPERAPGGLININVVTENYGAFSPNCLNTEIQLAISFSYPVAP
jgi:hypothetical protein